MPKQSLKVLPNEDQAEFDRLFESCRTEFTPRNLHEDFLVEQMAWSRWRVMRYQRFEDLARANDNLKAAAQMHRIANSAQKSHDQALRALKMARKVPGRRAARAQQTAPVPAAEPVVADTAYRA